MCSVLDSLEREYRREEDFCGYAASASISSVLGSWLGTGLDWVYTVPLLWPSSVGLKARLTLTPLDFNGPVSGCSAIFQCFDVLWKNF